MKIAVFHNLPPGGAKRVLYEEIKELSIKHNIDLYILSSTDENFLSLKPFVKNIFYYDFKIGSSFPPIISRLDKDFKNFITLKMLHKQIASDIDKKKYDVCLFHPDKLTQAPFLLRFLKTPSIYYCHELLRIAYEKELLIEKRLPMINRIYEILTRGIRKKIDRDNAQNADLILVASKYMALNVKRAYERDAKVCSLGVDIGVFKPIKSKKENKVLFIGQKEKINGYNFAKRVINLLPKNVRPILRVVGYSKGKLKLTDTQLAKEYSKSLATLCVSYNEPFGLVALESMACQTPVLAVNEGGYRETVIDGKTGFLLKRDPKIFAEKIKFLIKNKKSSYFVGKTGRDCVVKKWKWRQHNRKLERYMQNVGKTKLQ